jgi:hypothetical protein
MNRARLLIALALLVATADPSASQFVRPPVVVPRPSVPVVHVPVTPHSGNQGNQGADFGDLLWWGLGTVGAIVAILICVLVVRSWRRRTAPRAIVRIKALPPGEAPEFVRRAWIGLELPLILDQVQPEKMAVEGALSHQPVDAPPGYAVDGKAAIAVLESANAEIAAWWRENAPNVAAPGYQLVFPAEVCERLDDLGT